MKAVRLHEKNEVSMERVAVVGNGATLNRGWLTLLLTQQERTVKMEDARTTRKKMDELELSNYTLDGIMPR